YRRILLREHAESVTVREARQAQLDLWEPIDWLSEIQLVRKCSGSDDREVKGERSAKLAGPWGTSPFARRVSQRALRRRASQGPGVAMADQGDGVARWWEVHLIHVVAHQGKPEAGGRRDRGGQGGRAQARALVGDEGLEALVVDPAVNEGFPGRVQAVALT